MCRVTCASLGSFLSQPLWSASRVRASARDERQGGDQPDREAGLQKAPGEWTMVVAGGLESAGDRLAEAGQEVDKAVVVSPGVEHRQASPASVAGDLDQDLVAGLAD